MAKLLQNWWTFVRERFPLGSHIPMVGLFCLGNVALTENLTAKTGLFTSSIFIITFLFFFRLRCFDEIKDYQVDLKVNPTRPLARGVLTVFQVRIMIVCILFIELALASRMGTGPLVLHMVAMAYSLLMRVEFFIGKWLSRHLTTYAVTHTFVSMLLGLSIAGQATGVVNEDMLKAVIWAAPINWALFNLFEFARKTFAPEEERPNVESYSLNFGVLGAVVLSLSQVALALAVLWYIGLAGLEGFEIQAACALIPLLAGVYLVISKSKTSGQVFRTVTGAYLLLFYSILTYQGMFL
ncbi:MAG: manganese transporter permease [Oligoflexus sp.]|nr:manganese transporter permease [Oligoflexus sp.]